MGIFTLKVAGDVSILGKKLTSILHDNVSPEEEVLFCLKDFMELQILVALPSKILIIQADWLRQYTVVSFPYRDITSIEVVAGMMSSLFKINTSMEESLKRRSLFSKIFSFPVVKYNCFSFESMSLNTFLPYTNRIRTLMHECKKESDEGNKKSIAEKATNLSVAEQIEKLSNLRQSGALTEEEYLQAKKKILEA